MKSFLSKILAAVLIGIFAMQGMVYAEGETDNLIDVLECDTKLAPEFDTQTTQFLQFLDQHFQNKSSDSTLVNTALARYYTYKKILLEDYARIQPNVNAIATDTEANTKYKEALDQYAKCGEMTKAYINLAREKMMQRILDSNAQKKATVIVEKYKAINRQLGGLGVNMAYLYGYFKTFENKLPGFLGNECMKKIF
ncbi:MAG: hypothetical protein WC873_02395 [Candidatus Gracilibacteria bacterium]